MRTDTCTQERFLGDVAKLQMTILRDDGVMRHVRFKEPGSTTYMFDLITWPMHLCYSGDMGTYVFSRIIDMFEFFRTKPRSLHADQLYINLGYWAEKVLAQDRHGKIEEYVPEVAKRKLLRHLRYDVEDKAQRREIYDAVSRYLDDSEHEAREALSEHIDDTWEWNLSDYTSTFTWCCYALSWGIRQYDQAKALQGEMVEVAR